MRNKIGWCSMTFNPCWGCRNHCEYCYARKIAGFRYDRIAEKEYKYMYHRGEICQGEFANRLRHFVPTFIESNFNIKFPQKPQKIFVGSMSEIAHWREEWVEKVIEKIKLYPQHIFQFLTRHPEIYGEWIWPENCWLGVTVTNNISLRDIYFIAHRDKIKFISIEPILEEIEIELILENRLDVNWIIVGAETGNRKGKVIPITGWINKIVRYCGRWNIPIYLKDSLKETYPLEIKEFPFQPALKL